ncbi:MAG: hypothetical protein Q9166_001234 [cf. Caloplaca sp. 2 TL-2023]
MPKPASAHPGLYHSATSGTFELTSDQRGDSNHKTVLELYRDHQGSLVLAATSPLSDGEQNIIDAVAPLVQEYNQSHLGTQSQDKHNSPTNVHGMVQQHGMSATLTDRKKRGHSRISGSSMKRYKPSVKCPSEVSAEDTEVATPKTEANTPDVDDEDNHQSDHSDDDDGEDVLRIEIDEFDSIESDNCRALAEYYTRGFCQVGQLLIKGILKAWIKVMHPKKQSTHPYNGGKTKKQQRESGVVDDNIGRHTAPSWWPTQVDWKSGRGCRHREPDHLVKSERKVLALHMFQQLTKSDGHFTIATLKESTSKLEMRPDQEKMLEQLYGVREKELRYINGETSGDTLIYVFKPRPQPPRKKKKKRAVRKLNAAKVNVAKIDTVKGVKQEGCDTSESIERFIPGPAANTTEDLYSFSSSMRPLATAKSERQPPTVDYPGFMQAQYTPRNDNAEFIAATPNPDVAFGTVYAPDHQFQPNSDSFPQGVTSSVHDYQSDGLPIACPAPSRGRMPLRHGHNYLRRPTSVCKQDSPSYQQGCMPRQIAYDFKDDMHLRGFRIPHVSHGYPSTGLAIPLDDPRSHTHGGLEPGQQEALCIQHGCTLYRTLEQHRQGYLINGWQTSFNNQQTGVPSPVDLDRRELDELMLPHTPDSELTRSFP